jgi:hypothetical protein
MYTEFSYAIVGSGDQRQMSEHPIPHGGDHFLTKRS